MHDFPLFKQVWTATVATSVLNNNIHGLIILFSHQFCNNLCFSICTCVPCVNKMVIIGSFCLLWQAFSFVVSTRTNLSVRAICCTHEKSYSAEFGLVPLDILLSILCFCLLAPSLNNAVYVNSISQALVTTAQTPPKTEGLFYRAFLCRFSVSFFLNFFLLYKYTITNFEKSSIVPVIFCCDGRSV